MYYVNIPCSSLVGIFAGCFKMNFQEVNNLVNGPIIEMITWQQGKNIIANPLRCVPCNAGMALTEGKESHVDGFLFVYNMATTKCVQLQHSYNAQQRETKALTGWLKTPQSWLFKARTFH